MAATANPKSNTFTVNDVAPTISNILFNNSASISLNMKGESNKTVYASSTSVTDNNGCADIVGASSTVYMSNVSGGAACTADDNNCYKITSANCTVSGCSGVTANVVCNTALAYYASPTDASGDNPRSTYYWVASINIYDGSNIGSAASAAAVDVVSAAALDVTEATIPYGIIMAGNNSGLADATTTVVNYGNCPLNSDISGTWMSQGGLHIHAANQKYDLITFNYPAATYSLSSTTPATLDTNIARPNTSSDFAQPVYWGINIPSGTNSGVYNGTNTFQAALKAAGGNWN
jgi:hypothetical protein